MTTVYLAPGPFGAGGQFFGLGGLPLNLGTITTYAAGSTTPLATYTTSAGSVQNANPIPLGTDGRPPNEIWITADSYRFDLKDSLGNLIRTYDNLGGYVDTVNLASTSSTLGAYLVGWIRSATGAIATTVGRWLGWQPLNVKEFGAVGDGTTDDSSAFILAIAAASGKSLFINEPTSYYKLGSGLGTIPANTRLYGTNKRTSKIQRAFAGTQLMTLADGAELDNLYLEGDGANFAGKGIVIGGTDGNQNVTNCRIINFDGNPVEFTATTAGSRSNWDNVEASQTNGSTGSGKYAFVNANGSQLTAVPKSFDHIETGGTCAFDFGGSNDVFITNSFLADLAYTSNTRGVHIATTRVANQTALTIDGFNNTIVGCDLLPQITIAAGAGDNVIGPNTYNNATPVIDNSGLNTNLVFVKTVNYTPSLTSAGVAPVLNNGTLVGQFSREGSRVHFDIQFTVGGTTTLGTGQLRFSVPTTRVNSTVLESCTCLINIAGTLYVAVGQFAGGVGYVAPIRDTSGSVTFNSPAAFAAGDTIRISGSYYI